MRVLIATASKHEATGEIAQAIGKTLTSAGLDVTISRPEEVDAVAPYDAVILGSAVYVGHWLEPAKRLVERQREALVERPVWLFSSGPIGKPPMPEGEPTDIAIIREQTGARDHRVFPGRVERSRLGLVERVVMTAVHAKDGDFRPWDEIAEWAAGIAEALKAGTAGAAQGGKP